MTRLFTALRKILKSNFQGLSSQEYSSRERFLSRATSMAHLEQLERALERQEQSSNNFFR